VPYFHRRIDIQKSGANCLTWDVLSNILVFYWIKVPGPWSRYRTAHFLDWQRSAADPESSTMLLIQRLYECCILVMVADNNGNKKLVAVECSSLPQAPRRTGIWTFNPELLRLVHSALAGKQTIVLYHVERSSHNVRDNRNRSQRRHRRL